MAFEPTVLGHGSLATLDLPSTLATFLCVYLYWRYERHKSPLRFWVLALATTCAILVKFSALLLLPTYVLIWLALRLLGARDPKGEQPSFRFHRHLLAAVVASIVLSWAVYGFEVRSIAQDPQIAANRESESIEKGIGRVAERLGTTKDALMLLPIPNYSLLKGLGLQLFHAAFQDLWEDADFYQYLDGEYSRSGFRDYFVWTFAYKSTEATLVLFLLLGLLLVLGVLRGWAGRSTDWVFLLVPPLVHFLAISLQTINIGHRYAMPILPFLALGFAAVARASMRLGVGSVGWPARLTVVGLLLAHVSSSLAVAPEFLAYFNHPAGGVERGYEHLADSNIDWGQDLLFLAEDVRRVQRPDTLLYADVFGTVRPSDLGISLLPARSFAPPPPSGRRAIVYVSVNRYLLRSKLHPRGLYPFLTNVEPSRRVGASILVFEFQGKEGSHGTPRASF